MIVEPPYVLCGSFLRAVSGAVAALVEIQVVVGVLAQIVAAVAGRVAVGV
jgi:hypothetical protein